MMWLSFSTNKWLTADLKLKKKEEKKEAAAKDAKADGAAADGAAADDDDDAPADGPATDSKLMKALEFAAWGL